MHRLSAALLMAFAALSPLRAENRIEITAGGGTALPVRGLKLLVGTGYGFNASAAVLLNDNISIFALAGFASWQISGVKVNTSIAAAGGTPGYDITGPLQAVPLTLGGRLTFDGALIRPYIGLSGGACFLHRRFAGLSAPPGAGTGPGEFTYTWTEPAMSVNAGIRIVLSSTFSLDIGGIYTAFSNADDRIEPSDFFGTKITNVNTATYVGVQAGLVLGL